MQQFLAAWCEALPEADFNLDGQINGDDIQAYIDTCIRACAPGACGVQFPGSPPCRFATDFPTFNQSVQVVANTAGQLTVTASATAAGAVSITVLPGSQGSPGGSGSGSVSFLAQAGESFNVVLNASISVPCFPTSQRLGAIGVFEVQGGCQTSSPQTSEPEPLQRCVGQAGSLHFALLDVSPVQYQWYSAGAPLSDGPGVSGTHSSTLILQPSSPGAGLYYCIASYGCNQSKTSSLVSASFGAPGVCCDYQTGACTLTDPQCRCPGTTDLRINGGTCSQIPCPPPTTCCYSDGACAVTIADLCVSRPMVSAQPRPDLTCEPVNQCPPARQACCRMLDGMCYLAAAQQACPSGYVATGGTSAFATCEPLPCTPPTLVCCALTTGACSVVVASQCPDGTSAAPGRTVCAAGNLCPSPVGSAQVCCNLLRGACVVTLAATCPIGYVPNPGETSCGPGSCPSAAIECCTEDGGCGTINLLDCTLLGLSTMSCAPGVCSDVVGICCNAFTRACSLRTRGDVCPPGSTSFLGLGVCSPINPCQFNPPGELPIIGACCLGSTCSVTLSAAVCNAAGGSVVAGASVCNTGSPVTPCCKANFNHDAGVTVQDIFDFLAAWFAVDYRADFNGISGITVQDIFDFLPAWFAGC